MLLSGFLGGYTTLSSLIAETCSYGLTSPIWAGVNVVVQFFVGGMLLVFGRVVGFRIGKRVSRKGIAPNVEDGFGAS